MMRPSLRITNRLKGIGQGRSGKRRGRKEAFSRPNSNVYAYSLSDLEETNTESGDEGEGENENEDEDSEEESDNESDSSGGEDDSDCRPCGRVADAIRNWTGEAPHVRVGIFGKFWKERRWCDTCGQFVDYFTKQFQKRSAGSGSLRHITPVFLTLEGDIWVFRVGKA